MRRSEARRLLGGVYKGHVERHVRVVAQREVEGAAQGRDPPLRHAARKEEKLPVHGQPVKRCGSQFAAARRAGGSRRSLQGRERSLTRFAGGSHVPTRKHGCDTAKGVTRLWSRPRKGRGWGESPKGVGPRPNSSVDQRVRKASAAASSREGRGRGPSRASGCFAGPG